MTWIREYTSEQFLTQPKLFIHNMICMYPTHSISDMIEPLQADNFALLQKTLMFRCFWKVQNEIFKNAKDARMIVTEFTLF